MTNEKERHRRDGRRSSASEREEEGKEGRGRGGMRSQLTFARNVPEKVKSRFLRQRKTRCPIDIFPGSRHITRDLQLCPRALQRCSRYIPIARDERYGVCNSDVIPQQQRILLICFWEAPNPNRLTDFMHPLTTRAPRRSGTLSTQRPLTTISL